MKSRIAAAAVVVTTLAACSEPSAPPAAPAASQPLADAAVLFAPRSEPIPDEYIVVFKDGVTTGPQIGRQLAAEHGGTVRFTYDRVLNGFAGHFSAAAAAAIAHNPNVAYVEQDQTVHADATQSGATWGIDRIDQRSRPLSGTYTYTATASGVYAYIIDTGIQTAHADFGGRAAVSYDAIGGNGQDCNGHGTHVAGTVGGAKYGVAKGVRLRAVRVLDCNGSGSNSGVIAGMNWVATNHASPAVANMSLGGGYSASVNSAATSLVNSGVFLAVAAGNSSADACNYSPSSASGTITVAATTSSDARASYSNYGACVDVYAPGSSITSDWLSGGTNTISGTSMATPHVTGVGALYKATYGNAAASTIISWITSNATSGVITGNISGTPNRLLYKSTL